MVKKKVSLEDKVDALTTVVQKGFASMESCFTAGAEDIGDTREEMATKDQVIEVHTQVNSNEIELRGMNHGKPAVSRHRPRRRTLWETTQLDSQSSTTTKRRPPRPRGCQQPTN